MKAAKIAHHFFDSSLDYVDADLSKTIGGKYNRRIFFVKPFFYLIWDDIKTNLNGQYQLHVITDDNDPPIQNSSGKPCLDRVIFECQNDINLEVAILSPQNAVAEGLVNLSEDMYPVRFYAEQEGVPGKVYEKTPQWLQLDQASSGQDFVTVLYPRQADTKPLQLASYQQGKRKKDRKELLSVTIEIDSDAAQFYFGPQSNDICLLKGKAAVILSNKEESSRTVYLVDGTQFSQSDNYDISVDFPTTLAVRTLTDGKAYEIKDYGMGFERVELKLPWSEPVDKVRVYSADGQENVLAKHDLSKGVISLMMNEKVYRLIAGHVQEN